MELVKKQAQEAEQFETSFSGGAECAVKFNHSLKYDQY